MPKRAHFGTEAQCRTFSAETDQGTEGWWYHGTTEAACEAIARGRYDFEGADEIWFTRNPNGTPHKGDHTHVVRAMVCLQKSMRDRYFIEHANNPRDPGFEWLQVFDPSRVMFESDFCEAKAGNDAEAEAITEEPQLPHRASFNRIG